MSDAAPLLSVLRALPLDLQALSHVLQQIDDLLKPTTIDGAVYNELSRVYRVHGASRPITVGAMDGAATRGRLDIVITLNSTRTEGCSSMAGIGAAAKGHLDVLEWLYIHYPEQCNPDEEAVAAATGGHVEVVQFLKSDNLQAAALDRALEAAAANGHVAVASLLSTTYCHNPSPLFAAAANGHASVVQLLLDRGFKRYTGDIASAIEKAAESGHLDVVEMLLKCDDQSITMLRVITKCSGETMQFLLDRCDFDVYDVAAYLMLTSRPDIVRVILEHPTIATRSRDYGFMTMIQVIFLAASEKGSIGMVKELVGRCIPLIGEALKNAASNQQLEVVKLLLEVGLENQFDFGASIGLAAEKAASNRCIDMIKLLAAKCGIFDTKKALEIAMANNDMTMVVLLLDHSDQTSIEQVLLADVPSCNTELIELFWLRCNPATRLRVFEHAISAIFAARGRTSNVVEAILAALPSLWPSPQLEDSGTRKKNSRSRWVKLKQ